MKELCIWQEYENLLTENNKYSTQYTKKTQREMTYVFKTQKV